MTKPPEEWRGLVVPFITMWKSEVRQAVRKESRLDGRLAIFPAAAAPEGNPVLNAVDHSRQRLVVLERRCQVCAKPLGAWRWAAALGRECDVGDGWLRYEPPACRPCMALACRICPGLYTKKPEIQAVARELFALQLLKPDTLRAAGHDVPEGIGPVVGLVEYTVLELRERHGFDEFLSITENDFDRAAAARAGEVLARRP